MANDSNVDRQFSGSKVAKDASGAALSAYSSKLFALCDPNGKPILPPRVETAETSHTAVVHSVCGLGNAYAPSIGLPAAKRYFIYTKLYKYRLSLYLFLIFVLQKLSHNICYSQCRSGVPKPRSSEQTDT